MVKKESVTVLTEPPKLSTASNVTELVTECSTEVKEILEEMSSEDIEKILIAKVGFCKENSLAARTCDDILKRIKIFITNWPKLNEKVKLKMSELVRFLEKDELSKANEIHIQLMMDYPSEVVSWMVGIK